MAVWEEALDRSILELQAGALPWSIEPDALRDLRDKHFKDGFREAYEKTPDDWPKQMFRVLRMAKCAGMLAGLFAEWKTGDPLTTKVQLVHLLAAMAIVKPGCGQDRPVKVADPKGAKKYDSGRVFRGKPCQRTTIDQAAKDFLKARMAEFEVKP